MCGGVFTVRRVDDVACAVVPAVPPNVTVSGPVKLVPVMVTDVPPEALPLVGEILVAVGGV